MRLKRPEGMNVVPFIDVMLVLLAIVLTISTFIAQGKIKVDLPSATSAIQQQDRLKALEIIIDSDDKIYIKDTEVSMDELKEAVMGLKNSDEIIILGDKTSNFGRFIDVIDVLKIKGHENVQIVTKHEK
ncbi:MAG: TonB system transport protein ExbD [Campylobacteraceae bacterium]|jgi:biopolymer transport protein ExbD|nr:TonB system transport protein ExbD [Campylobacteraceae bacterium]